MTTKIFLAAFIVAAGLSILASLIDLAALFPAFLLYFVIALLGGCLTTFWLIRPVPSGSVRREKPARSKKASKGKAKAKAKKSGKREQGKVKWFSASKGFGFITRDNGEDIFVHFRSILGSGHRVLQQGQEVEFLITEGSKGLQAEDVSPLGKDAEQQG